MTELVMWEYEGKTESGIDARSSNDFVVYLSNASVPHKYIRRKTDITNLRPAKVVDAKDLVLTDVSISRLREFAFNAEPVSKCTKVERDNFCAVLEQLLEQTDTDPTPPEPKKTLLTREQREKIYHHINHWRQFPWALVIENDWQTAFYGHGYSPYAEDWQHILNPKVEEPTGFGEINNPKSKSYVPVGDNFLDSCHYIWQAVRLLSPDFAKAMLINSVMLTPNKDGSYSFNANIRKDDK